VIGLSIANTISDDNGVIDQPYYTKNLVFQGQTPSGVGYAFILDKYNVNSGDPTNADIGFIKIPIIYASNKTLPIIISRFDNDTTVLNNYFNAIRKMISSDTRKLTIYNEPQLLSNLCSTALWFVDAQTAVSINADMLDLSKFLTTSWAVAVLVSYSYGNINYKIKLSGLKNEQFQ
jgi:hypothetical protein